MLKRSIGGLIAALAMMVGVEAFAQGTATGNLAVSATVTSTCSITASTLGFGNYNGTAIGATAATFTVNCNVAESFAVNLDGGLQKVGTLRYMSNIGGGTDLAYQLWTDSLATDEWSIDETVSSIACVASGCTIGLWGTVAGSQTGLMQGPYTDTVAISIVY